MAFQIGSTNVPRDTETQTHLKKPPRKVPKCQDSVVFHYYKRGPLNHHFSNYPFHWAKSYVNILLWWVPIKAWKIHVVQYFTGTQSIGFAPGWLLCCVVRIQKIQKTMFSFLIISLLSQRCHSQQVLGEFLSSHMETRSRKLWRCFKKIYILHFM